MDTKDTQKIVASWLRDLSIPLGVDLTLNDEGICAFQIGEKTSVTLEVSPDFPLIHLYSVLISYPYNTEDVKNTEIIIKALELNAQLDLTLGGAIAFAPGDKSLIFCTSMPIEGLDAGGFAEILEAFFKSLNGINYLLLEIPVFTYEKPQPKVKEMLWIKI